MPSIVVEVRREYSPEEETAILQAVIRAVGEAFRIPPTEQEGRLVVYQPHRFVFPPAITQPESYTIVSIDCFEGRSLAAKRKLYQNIVRELAVFGIPDSNVMIMLREIPKHNWGICGGKAGCDVEVGFEIEV